MIVALEHESGDVRIFYSVATAARAIGCHVTQAWKMVRGKGRTVAGWRLLESGIDLGECIPIDDDGNPVIRRKARRSEKKSAVIAASNEVEGSG